MSNKRWSYRQITQSAEKTILLSMRLAEKARAKGDNESAYIHECFAMGAEQMWHGLVMGWIKEGDAERLKSLRKGIKGTA